MNRSKAKQPCRNMKHRMKSVKKKLEFNDGLAWNGVVWYYRFTIRGKAYLGSTDCSNKSEAREALIQIKAKKLKETNSGIVRSKDVPTFKEAVDFWYLSRKGKRSDLYLDTAKKQLENHVIPKLGNIRCNLINYDVVEVVLNDYLHGRNLQFQNKKHNIGGYNTLASWISAVLGNLVPKYLEIAPKIKLERVQRKKKPFIPMESVDEFLTEIDRTNNLHVSVAIRAMLYMGLRESEALGLKWENIDWTENTYCPGGIVGSVEGTKGKDGDSLPFPSDMALWLRKAQEKNKEEKSEWVIPAKDGKPHRKQFTKKAIARGGCKIEKKLSPHRLRGTYATLLAKKGGNAFLIKKAGRWKDIKTAEGYIELGLEDLKKANTDLWESDKPA